MSLPKFMKSNYVCEASDGAVECEASDGAVE